MRAMMDRHDEQKSRGGFRSRSSAPHYDRRARPFERFYDAYYAKAQRVRTLIRQDFDAAFAKCDVLATPTAPSVAFPLGDKTDDPIAMKLADVCTIPVNMAGLPALSLPCGSENGLPIGLQLIGKLLDESTLLRAAHAYEQATDWHEQRPDVE